MTHILRISAIFFTALRYLILLFAYILLHSGHFTALKFHNSFHRAHETIWLFICQIIMLSNRIKHGMDICINRWSAIFTFSMCFG